MKLSLVTLAPWTGIALVLLGTTAVGLRRRARRPVPSRESDPAPAAGEVPATADAKAPLRSYALDVLGEAVLIMDRDGHVKDCNSSALTLFDRHRAVIEGQSAATLRRFEGLDQGDPHRVAAQHAVWMGEAWARQPDGGVKLCLARVIATRDTRLRVTGYVESFRDVTTERPLSEEFRDLLYGVRAFDSASASPAETMRALREEIRVLSEAFRDLDLVIRQYERLLPSLAADEPLTEMIAGPVSDVRATVTAVGVPGLLAEIPRVLSRLRTHLEQVAAELGTEDASTGAEAGNKRSESP